MDLPEHSNLTKLELNWESIDSVARTIYKLIHAKKLTYLEIDTVLNLVTTECNNAKYRYLLSIPSPSDASVIKDIPKGVYG